MSYELSAEDREAAELGAKTCWNKFTRFADKSVEIIFILTLSGIGIWGIVK